eukprot:1163700-Prorocentrum_lima.AAC.1
MPESRLREGNPVVENWNSPTLPYLTLPYSLSPYLTNPGKGKAPKNNQPHSWQRKKQRHLVPSWVAS